jgi:hypothetical protein
MPKRLARERYEVEWWVLTDVAKARRDADPMYEHDRDRDEQSMFKVFLKEKDALAFARSVVDQYQTVYGHATVTKQRLEKVEDTTLWEWENVSEPEYVE